MANYVLSDTNRFYTAIEASYGIPAPISSFNRLAAFRLGCHQSVELTKRRDKTGSRTYLGSAGSAARQTHFEITSHLVSWDGVTQPAIGPLVNAAMGAGPERLQGISVTAASGTSIEVRAANPLKEGAALSDGSEIRFVNVAQSATRYSLNAPFAVNPAKGATLSTTVGYGLATQLPSVSFYDYWDPSVGVSRLLVGAGVDRFRIEVHGDIPELVFSGPAADVLDSVSGVFGVSPLSVFPAEPSVENFEYSIVGGQLGQVWLGAPLNQVFTLTDASIEIRNNLKVRNAEFGSAYPRAIAPGPREIVSMFTLFAQGDAVTQALYSAAKTRTPISALLQLGQQKGQMMAVYLQNVVPEVPLFDDSEAYLLWTFKNNLSEGVADDEAYIAFA